MKVKFKYEIGFLILLASIFILMLVSGILVNRNLTKTVDRVSIQLQPDEKLIVMKSISKDLLEAENQLYSFNLTRDRSYLNNFYLLTNETEKKTRRLKNYSSRDPYYKKYVDSLEKLLISKYVIMDSLLIVQNQYRVNETLNLIEQSMREVNGKQFNSEEESAWRRVFSKKDKKSTQSKNNQIGLEQFQRELVDIKKTEGKKEISNNQLELSLIQSDRLIMSEIDNLLATLESTERNSIAIKTKEAREAATNAKNIVLVFTILLTLLLLASCFVIIKYILRNNEYKLFLQKAKEQSEEIADSKVRFVSILSHEIKTPLNAIIGFTEQLSLQKNRSWTQEQSDQLGYIRRSSGHLSQIVHQILDYTKLHAQQVQLESIPFDPKREVREIFEILQQTADASQNELQLISSASVPSYLLGDPVKFRQIILNLLSNALKFTEKGKVTVRMHAEALEDNAKIHLMLEVEDNGVGIDERQLETIFDEFRQENSSITRGYGGTGLGLSICRMLVELHHGKITVNSTKGKGSTFTLDLWYLPCHEPIQQQDILPQKNLSLKAMKVLLADDEPYNRKLLESILSKTEISIVQAEDGLMAWQIFQREPFDLVLVDIQMPKMNGIEVCKKIRTEADEDRQETPVVAITAGWSEELERESDLFHAIVGKPVKEIELIRIIRLVLSGEKLGFKVAEPMEKKSNAPYDISKLVEMSNGDESFVKGMIETFVRTTKEGIAELKLQLEKNDLLGMVETSHRISSPCRHLEILNLYQLFKRLEREAKSTESGEENERLILLLAEIQNVASPIFEELENVST